MSELIYIQLPQGYRLKALDCEAIAQMVCAHFDVPLSKVRSHRRTRMITDVRHIICYFCHQYSRQTLAQIGKFLGGRDHTTVLHGRDKIKDLMDTYDPLSVHVQQLQQQLETKLQQCGILKAA